MSADNVVLDFRHQISNIVRRTLCQRIFTNSICSQTGLNMVPRVLQRRSSWPSSFVTGLIGWNGFAVIAPLSLGYSGDLGELFVAGTLAAVAQVLLLRSAFFALRMDRSLVAGGTWGGLTAALLILIESTWIDVVGQHTLIALGTGIYVGIPVGVFLSYFYKDDREIESQATEQGVALPDVDYGRDGHWLDPFVYGAACYLLAFFPTSVALAICSATVGSIVGVVAAGVSHFVLSKWNNAVWTIPMAIGGGAIVGLVSGLLFRNVGAQLWTSHLTVGSLAGALTFGSTAIVGRKLGLKEQADQPTAHAPK